MDTIDKTFAVAVVSGVIGISTMVSKPHIKDAVYTSHVENIEQINLSANIDMIDLKPYNIPKLEANLATKTNDLYFEAGKAQGEIDGFSSVLIGLSAVGLLGSIGYIGKNVFDMEKERKKNDPIYFQSE